MSEKLKKFFLGDYKPSPEIDEEEDTEENTETDKQRGGDETTKTILLLILVVLTVGVSVFVFTALQDHLEEVKRYQDCFRGMRG